MELSGQPVVVKGKVYVRGMSGGTNTVLEYTPSSDVWDTLPPPTVYNFTIATLNEHLVLVGGRDQSTDKVSKKIIVWDSGKHQWIYPYPSMTTGRVVPAAVGYRDHLIVACGLNSEHNRISNVDILDTTSNKWLTAESLPDTDHYRSVIIDDTLYLVGFNSCNVLRANIPTLISRASSTKPAASQSVWESLPNAPIYRSFPVAIDNVLITVGGNTSGNIFDHNPTSSIQLYNPTNNIWTKVGDLPEAVFNCYCTLISGELLVLGGRKGFTNFTRSVYVSKLIMQY